jgi:ABC-2 type transport system permease protein
MFSNIPTLNGWTLPQLLFMLGIITTAYGLQHVFFSGVRATEWLVQNGEMDRFLLRPIHVLPHIFMWESFDVDGFGDVITGVVILFFASGMLAINWTLFTSALFLIMLASATVILTAFSMFLSALAFWVVKTSSIFDIFYMVMKFVEYPIEIYNPITILLLTVVFPVAFTSYYPAQIFVGHGIWMTAAYLTPLVAIITFSLSYTFWYYGLKHYGSTGS